MKTGYDVILRPIITENSMDMAAEKKYAFKVAADANKTEVRKAIEEIKESYLEGLEFHYVRTNSEVLELALEK